MSELSEAINSMRNMREAYDQIATAQASLASDVQSIKDAHIIGFNYDGLIFAEGFEPQSAFGIVANRSKIVEIHDDKDDIVPNVNNTDYPLLTVFEMGSAVSISISRGSNVLSGMANLKKVNIRDVDFLFDPNMFLNKNPVLRELNMLNFRLDVYSTQEDRVFLSSCPELIDITAGKRFSNANASQTRYAKCLMYWYPEAAMNEMDNLLTDKDKAAGFTTNLQKLLYNIREHIAANLTNRVGLSPWTITFNQSLRNVFDQETDDAFAAKGWSISPSKTV